MNPVPQTMRADSRPILSWARHLVFLALSLLFASRFFPLLDPTTHCMTNGDPALMCWSLQWVSHALVHDPLHLFQGNIFYPYSHAVVLTDAMVSLAVPNIVVRLFTDNPWVGYNLLIVLAFYLSALSGAWLAEELTGSRLVGLWGGIFWGFLFFRIHHIGHLQILSFQGIPAAIVCLARWWRQPGARTTILFVLVFIAQALVSWYLAVILGVILAIVGLVQLFGGRLGGRLVRAGGITLGHVRYGVLALLLSAAAIVPIAWPYARAFDDSSIADRMKLVNTQGDAVRPADYLTPPDATFVGHRLPGNRYWIWQENTLYVGYIALALALAGAAMGRDHEGGRRWVLVGGLLVLAGYVLALGFVSPALGVRLPLHYMARALPVVAGMRATQRFSLVLYAGILVLSSLGLSALVGRLRSRWAATSAAVVLSAVFLFEVFPLYLPFANPAPAWRFSEADRAIARLQKGVNRPLVVLHLPIHYFTEPYPVSEATYMVGSTLHWARILNGFSGGEPAGFLDRMRVLSNLPAPPSVAELHRLHVDVVAVHTEETAERRAAITSYYQDQPGASILRVPGGDVLVLLLDLPGARG